MSVCPSANPSVEDCFTTRHRPRNIKEQVLKELPSDTYK